MVHTIIMFLGIGAAVVCTLALIVVIGAVVLINHDAESGDNLFE
jgi:hypothetical protein